MMRALHPKASEAAICLARLPSQLLGRAVSGDKSQQHQDGQRDQDVQQEEGQRQDSDFAPDEFNPYAFIKSLPPYDDVVPPHRPRPVLLPPKKRVVQTSHWC